MNYISARKANFILSLIRFDQFHDPMKNTYFSKFYNRNLFEIIAIFRMKPNFFPRQVIAKIIFVSHSRYPWYTSYQVWFNLDNSMTLSKRLFLKLPIRNNRNFSFKSQTFSRGKLYQNSFFLGFLYTGDTPYQVWFNLDNSMTLSKRTNIKITYSKYSQFFVEKHNFFQRSAIPQILFSIYTLMWILDISLVRFE